MEKDIDELFEQLKKGKSNSTFSAKAYLEDIKRQKESKPHLEKPESEVNELLLSQSLALDEQIKRSNFELLDADIERINQEIEKDFGVMQEDSLPKSKKEQLALFGELEKRLTNEIIGQDDYLTQLLIAFKRPFVMGSEEDPYLNSLLISGQEGSGKHTSIFALASIASELKIFDSPQVEVMDLSLYPTINEEKLFLQDFYMSFAKKSCILVFDHIEAMAINLRAMLADLIIKGKIHLNKRYAINNQQLVEANNTLVSEAVSTMNAKGKYLIFITKKKSTMLDLFGFEMMSAIHDDCQTGPFEIEDCLLITKRKLEAYSETCLKRLGYQVTWDESLISEILAHFKQETGVYSILNQIKVIYEALVQTKLEKNERTGKVKVSFEKEIIMQFEAETLPLSQYAKQTKSNELKAIYQEMDKIIGLKTIKEYILSLQDHLAMQERRSAQGLKTAEVSMHMIFTGNPGTGKTTIARLVSKYLKAIGALSGGQLIEVSRGDLVGRYVGHTAPLVNQVINSALGGVLFIDEAYSLYRGKDDSFGMEAIDTLVKGMEDHRNELVVILAGYSNEMKEFLTANSGLESRFPNIIDFPDYTADEMVKISLEIAHSKDYKIDNDALQPLHNYFRDIRAIGNQASGNGRLARNLIEKAILNQSQRLVVETNEALDLLLLKDFDLDKELKTS